MQFIHLVSQIVLQTSKPVDTVEERAKILPTQGFLRQLIQSWTESFDQQTINDIVEGVTDTVHRLGTSNKKHSSSLKIKNLPREQAMKLLLYKFFFFNYIFQVTGPSILDSLASGEPVHELAQYSKDMAPIERPDEWARDHPTEAPARVQMTSPAENADVFVKLIDSLLLILQTLKARRMNARFDQAIKLPNQNESDNRLHHNRHNDHID